jgi:metal-responsive CopG/Arc/MetJ family transcriptional regulator
MRTLVDIPEGAIQALNEMAESKHASRASLIREAIELFLATQARQSLDPNAFGILKDAPIEGLKFQEALRGEWN